MFSTSLLITLYDITNNNYNQLNTYILLVGNTFMSKIYTITNNINNKKYVGKTSRTLQERINEHKQIASSNSKSKGAIHHAISKYGIENFSIKCIEECDAVRENQREKYWIKMLQTHVSLNKGYNMTLGGDGIKLVREDWGAHPQSKPVSKYDLDNNHIRDYDSIGLAITEVLGNERRLGGKCSIRNCCNGKQRMAFGYRWSWKDCDLPDVSHLRKYTMGKVYGIKKDGTTKCWSSQSDCMRDINTCKRINKDNAQINASLKSNSNNKCMAYGWYLFRNKKECALGKFTPNKRFNGNQHQQNYKKYKGVSVTNPDDIVYYDNYLDMKKDGIYVSNVTANIRNIEAGKTWTKCYNRQWYYV